jgi:thiamine-phosphate pyrophosphorylase
MEMNWKENMDYTLYVCTDRQLMSCATMEESVEEAIKGGASVIQLRDKTVTGRQFFETAKALKQITDQYQVPLIINDRVDIAMAVDAAGVHLGQNDLPAEVARKMLGKDKLIGVSTAKPQEAIQAVRAGADYIGVGAIFATGTKTNTRPVTMETLAKIRQAVEIPIVVIGGIKAENAAQFSDTGINGLAVVSAVIAQQNIKEAATRMRELFLQNNRGEKA